MLSARTIFEEILDNDEAFRLFCSIAASGEANWRRHLDTDLTATPSACAAPAFDVPSAHARMIRARSTRQRSGNGRCAQCRTGARTPATAGLFPAPRRRWPRTTARPAVIVTHFGTRSLGTRRMVVG